MKAPKYIYNIYDADNNNIDNFPWGCREHARRLKRDMELDHFNEYGNVKFPIKIVRFKVAPTGEVIR